MTQTAMFSPTAHNECVFSACRKYRYVLRRVVNAKGRGACLWVLANPSVADEYKLDPTLKRCAAYTEEWGFSTMAVVNVRAWVSTVAKAVPADPLAIGPENNDRIVFEAARANLVVCGWGNLGGERGRRVLALLRDIGVNPHALKLNEDGSPVHPLYQPASLKPFPMLGGAEP